MIIGEELLLWEQEREENGEAMGVQIYFTKKIIPEMNIRTSFLPD